MHKAWVLGAAALLAACGGAIVDEDQPTASDVAQVPAPDEDGEPGGLWAETRADELVDDGQRAAAATPDGVVKRATVAWGPTRDPELIEELPVGRSADSAPRRVLLRMRPDELPGLRRGDRLLVPAEVQLTTRCDVGQRAPGCNYDPKIAVQLILSGRGDDVRGEGNGSRAIAALSQTCTKAEHHCMFVFRPAKAQAVLERGFALPCVASGGCFINLVAWAWHPDARSSGQDKLLVGGNEGNYLANGQVEGDKARLMAVRERGLTAADRAARHSAGGSELHVPTNASPTLVYSHALKPAGRTLERGEQFLVEARLVVAVSSRARFSTKMFVTRDPRARDGDGLDAIAPSAINEHNGINCTAGTSPCTVRKVAVFRVQRAIGEPVFVNVASRSAVPGGGSARVRVKRSESWVRSLRYPARLAD